MDGGLGSPPLALEQVEERDGLGPDGALQDRVHPLVRAALALAEHLGVRAIPDFDSEPGLVPREILGAPVREEESASSLEMVHDLGERLRLAEPDEPPVSGVEVPAHPAKYAAWEARRSGGLHCLRGDAGADERDGLENRWSREGPLGSNPSPPADTELAPRGTGPL